MMNLKRERNWSLVVALGVAFLVILSRNTSVLVPTEVYSKEGVSPVKKSVLPNGLTILTKESKANDIVAVTVTLRMGPGYETDEQAGLSDLTQNLLLRGTTNRTAEQIAMEIESVGAKLSASAGRDWGVVALMTTRDGLAKGLEILFDVLQNANFPADKVEQEKEMALRRIKAREDQFLTSAVDLLIEAYYLKHPYHKPSLGYSKTVEKFDRNTILNFYKDYYVPNNMIFSAVGNFDETELLSKIEANFGISEEKDLPVPPKGSLPDHSTPQELMKDRETEAAWVAMGYGAPSITDPDFPAMEVFDSITGGSMNSRLFVELRDKRGLAYQVGSRYIARPGPSIYVTYVGTRTDQFAVARDGILEEMRKIRTEPVTEQELEASKKYLKGTFIMEQERNISQASLLSQYELVGLGYDFVDRYPELITNVTKEDILQAARKYITDNYVLGTILPKGMITPLQRK